VVGSDWCGVGAGHGGFEFDSEGDVVGVHFFVFSLEPVVGRGRFASGFSPASGLQPPACYTHMSHACLATSSQVLHVFGSNLHVFWEATRSPELARVGAQKRAKHGAKVPSVRDCGQTVRTCGQLWKVGA
jgi:hypothetical protein